MLANTPQIGRARPDLAEELRSIPLGRYLLAYDFTDTTLRLVRVLHASRNIGPEMFEDE
jgi:toxin ParE1/3/4